MQHKLPPCSHVTPSMYLSVIMCHSPSSPFPLVSTCLLHISSSDALLKLMKETYFYRRNFIIQSVLSVKLILEKFLALKMLPAVCFSYIHVYIIFSVEAECHVWDMVILGLLWCEISNLEGENPHFLSLYKRLYFERAYMNEGLDNILKRNC